MTAPMRHRAGDTLSVGIVDDHLSYAEALAVALNAEPDLEVRGIVSNPWDARELAASGVDALVLDVKLDEHDGLALCAELSERHPNLPIVILTAHTDAGVLERALEAGAAGFVLKTMSLRDVVSAVRSSPQRQGAVPMTMVTELIGRRQRMAERDRERSALRQHLSDREIEILTLLAAGVSTSAMAKQLHLSLNTVRTHIQNVLSKLGAHSRLEAVAYAFSSGLIEPPVATP